MAPERPRLKTRHPSAIQTMEADPAHHLTGPFLPQTPIGSAPPTPPIVRPRRFRRPRTYLWEDIKSGRWIVKPESALKLLSIPIILHLAWTAFQPEKSSPFSPLLFLSHPDPTSTPDDPRYQKGWLDLIFIAYHIVVWSFVRQSLTLNVARVLGRKAGIRQETKLDRFGEQFYAIVYFTFFGIWGVRIMSQLPTWWYDTKFFWIGYPHWNMIPELKRYYLMHAAYWCQQAIVMIFRLEKPRKDYNELIAHHVVTLWLIGWSYLINLTLIGNAVFLSMDIPDVWLALPKLLNYMRWEKTKTVVFAIFLPIWTYFRIYLNVVMLYSVWTEFDLIPEHAKRWYAPDGVWLTWWMRYQIFFPILLLLGLNLFWYFLILRIAHRSITGNEISDSRSDDEDEGEDDGKVDDDKLE